MNLLIPHYIILNKGIVNVIYRLMSGTATSLKVISNSNRAITFSFKLIPFEKGMNLLIAHYMILNKGIVNVIYWLMSWTATSLKVSSNSSRAITFTFRLIPFEKGMNLLTFFRKSNETK